MANDGLGLDFTEKDKLFGGPRLKENDTDLVRTVDQTGMERFRRKGRMAGNVRDKILMAQMKAGMAALWATGMTYDKIADEVSDHYNLQGEERLSGHGIQYHIKQMLEYWRQKGLALIDERQAVILARFDQIEALAMEGYFASMEGKSTTTINKQIEKARNKKKRNEDVEKEHSSRREQKDLRTVKQKDSLYITDESTVEEGQEALDIVSEKHNSTTRHEENRAGDPKFLNIVKDINIQRAKILGLYNRTDHMDKNSEAAKLSDAERQQRLATLLSEAQRRANMENKPAVEEGRSVIAAGSPLGGFVAETPEASVETEEEVSWDLDNVTLDDESDEVSWDLDDVEDDEEGWD